MSISPVPMHNESAIGYTLRFAARNGFHYLDYLLDVKTIAGIVKGSHYPAHIGKLSSQFKVSGTASLSSIFNPLFKENRLLTARVCMECVTQNDFIHEEVQNPFKITCSEHSASLVSQCYRCCTPLTWDIGLLNGLCTNRACGMPLQISGQVTLPELTEQQVSDCIVASRYMDSPNLCSHKVSKWPKVSDYEATVLSGYRLMTQPDVAAKWLETLARTTPSWWPCNFRLLACKKLIEDITYWPNKSIFGNCLSLSEQGTTEADCNVPVAEACSLITGSADSLKRLQHEGVIPRSHTKISSRSNVNLSGLLSMLNSYGGQITNQLPLSELRNVLDYYALDIESILIGIKHERLSIIYQPGLDLAGSIFVEETELTRFGVEEFKHYRPHDVSIKKAQRLTGLSESTLRRMRKTGQLRRPRVNSHGNHERCRFEDVIALRQAHELKQLPLMFVQE